MPVDSVQRAIDLLEKGRAEQAAPLLEDVVDAYPAYPGAYVLLGRAYEAGERWSRAQDAWRVALRLVPDSPVALEGLRRTLRQGRRLQTSADAGSYAQVENLHRAADRAQRDASREHASLKHASREDASREDAAGPTQEPSAGEEPPGRWVPVPEAGAPDEVASASSIAPAAPSEPSTARTTLAGSPADDNLERLISELEGARITPRPDIDQIPAPDFDDDIEDLVSETLARIYASQGQHLEAARVYDALAEQHPERAAYFEQRALEMRDAAGSQT